MYTMVSKIESNIIQTTMNYEHIYFRISFNIINLADKG